MDSVSSYTTKDSFEEIKNRKSILEDNKLLLNLVGYGKTVILNPYLLRGIL